MWVLMFFQLINNNLSHYQLGQYPTQQECAQEKDRAVVLVTTSNIALSCFEVK
tara:strand:+ start:118 stop:276 length:159 start_codon:yes stop_codon:yes gene_type:complete